ncbi:MAG: DoxX family protein [Planctomycetota bacterium]
MVTQAAADKARSISGWIVLGFVGAVLIFAGVVKAGGMLPAENLEEMGPLGERVRLIGTGALVSAVLLLVPRTSSLGILFVSSYWGGAICTHMLQETAYTAPAVLLVLTWVGSALRDRRSMWSFFGCGRGIDGSAMA